MSSLVIQPTSTAMWQGLVHEAEAAINQPLDTDMESYLVFLLMRFAGKPEMASKVMALEYLHGMLSLGQRRQGRLREVGDTCLLYAGLFPRQAARRRVRVSYYVDMGRSAYQQLGGDDEATLGDLFRKLAEGFVSLMDVLHAIRKLGHSEPLLDTFAAHELWQDSGSASAWRSLQQDLPPDTLPGLPGSGKPH